MKPTEWYMISNSSIIAKSYWFINFSNMKKQVTELAAGMNNNGDIALAPINNSFNESQITIWNPKSTYLRWTIIWKFFTYPPSSQQPNNKNRDDQRNPNTETQGKIDAQWSRNFCKLMPWLFEQRRNLHLIILTFTILYFLGNDLVCFWTIRSFVWTTWPNLDRSLQKVKQGFVGSLALK